MSACIKCGRSHSGVTSHCAACLSRKRKHTNSRRARFLATGMCGDCGRQRDVPNKKSCSSCLESLRRRNNQHRIAYRSTGKCISCGKTADGKYCAPCKVKAVDSNRRRQQALIRDGKCIKCAKPVDVARGQSCKMCILKATAHTWLGTAKRAPELRALLEAQDYKCPYTGRNLEIGRNATIDHKVPRSRGGTDDIGNLQWVDWQVNKAKTDMTHDEFITLCRLVADRAANSVTTPNFVEPTYRRYTDLK